MTNKEAQPPLTPANVFCPNLDCPAREQTAQGNIGVHHQKERRFICRECGKTFSASTGTVFYQVKKATDVITLVVTLLAHGCPMQAIVAACGFDERTVKSWSERSGWHAQQVHAHLVEQPRRFRPD